MWFDMVPDTVKTPLYQPVMAEKVQFLFKSRPVLIPPDFKYNFWRIVESLTESENCNKNDPICLSS